MKLSLVVLMLAMCATAPSYRISKRDQEGQSGKGPDEEKIVGNIDKEIEIAEELLKDIGGKKHKKEEDIGSCISEFLKDLVHAADKTFGKKGGNHGRGKDHKEDGDEDGVNEIFKEIGGELFKGMFKNKRSAQGFIPTAWGPSWRHSWGPPWRHSWEPSWRHSWGPPWRPSYAWGPSWRPSWGPSWRPHPTGEEGGESPRGAMERFLLCIKDILGDLKYEDGHGEHEGGESVEGSTEGSTERSTEGKGPSEPRPTPYKRMMRLMKKYRRT